MVAIVFALAMMCHILLGCRSAPTDLIKSSLAVRNMFVRCVPAPILAPKADCRTLLVALYHYARAYPTQEVTWGRTVTPLGQNDPSRFNLPYGFQLQYVDPEPGQQPNKCEINVDNEVEKEDHTEIFSLMDMVFAGLQVLDICMEAGWAGKAFPCEPQNVYVSTLYTPGDGTPTRPMIGGTQNGGPRNTTVIYVDTNGNWVPGPNSSASEYFETAE